MHPYMAQGIAEERVADFIRAAEADRVAREAAMRGTRRRFGSRRRRSAGRHPSHTSARLVIAHSGPAKSDNDQDRSPELCEAGR